MSNSSLYSLELNIGNNVQMSKKELKKMMFIMNAIENGWTVKKNSDSFVFSKKHENRREIMMNDYLEKFIGDNSK